MSVEERIADQPKDGDESPFSPPQEMYVDFEPEEPSTPDRSVPVNKLMSTKDEDQFLRDFYYYFQQKGFWNVVVKEVFRVVLNFFILVVTFVIFNHVNLYGLAVCKGEECYHVPIWINSGLIRDYTLFNYFIILLCLFILAYVIYVSIDVTRIIYRQRRIKNFVILTLEIPNSKLQTITWGEFVNTLVVYNNTVTPVLSHTPVDALYIANRIMLIENILIALESTSILRLKIPILKERVLPSFLRMNLNRILMRYVERDKTYNSYQSSGLIKSFRLLGLLHFLLSPFILFFVIIRTSLRYFADFQLNKSFAFATRRWSTLTLQRFRCYNELPHEFERRIGKANEFAELYCQQFPQPEANIIGKLIMFFSSSLAAVFVVMVTIRNPVLIHVTFLGQTILWWSLVMLGVFTFGSSLVESDPASPRPKKYFRRLARHTLYVPDKWRGKEETWKVYRDFISNYYQTTIRWFLIEFGSIVITPLILSFKLPDSAKAIAEFFEAGTNDETICGFATFDFNKYQNFSLSVYENEVDKKTNRMINRKVTYVPNRSDKKMEASYLLFRKNHPEWKENEGVLGTEILLKSLIRVNEEKLGKEFADRYLQKIGFNNNNRSNNSSPIREETIIDMESSSKEDIEMKTMIFEDKEEVEDFFSRTVIDNLTSSEVADQLLTSYVLDDRVNLQDSMMKLKREISATTNKKVRIDGSSVFLGVDDEGEGEGGIVEGNNDDYDDELELDTPDSVRPTPMSPIEFFTDEIENEEGKEKKKKEEEEEEDEKED